MIDIVREIEATRREVATRPAGDGAPIRSVRLVREFDAPLDDVWDALSNPDRIGRWFLPISGDFRIGGRFQFEGNAGGEILICQRPSYLKATWVYGEPAPGSVSEVEVRLSAIETGGTRFDFEHSATVPDEQWNQYGPGAVGVGWDGGVLGLGLHLRTGATIADPEAWQVSEEGRDFYTRSSAAWGVANRAAGADPEVVARNVTNTTAFYAPEPQPAS